jgi:hypothetical protein
VATRERPQLLTPAREPFDGRVPGATAVFPTEPAETEPTVELAETFFEEPKPPSSALPEPQKGDGFVVLGEGGERELEELVRAGLVEECADTVGMLARHRAERPMKELAENERQLVAQVDAFAISGHECVRSLVAWWQKNADDPWKAWGATFMLACLDGIDVLQAILREVEALPEDALEFVEPIAEALLVAPHPHVPDLARELLGAQSPIARAIAIELLGRRGELAAEELAPCLADAHLAVVAAAARACASLPARHGVSLLAPLSAHHDPMVAWPSARQLLVWGRPEPYFDVCAGRAQALGQHALEVLVYAGNVGDLEVFERVLGRAKASEAQLSAVARFGAPSAWALLVHHLANPELEDAALRALVTLFGERVPLADAKKPAAWRAAIAKARFEPTVRYRRGEPWRPRAVAQELARGDMPRAEMRARLDELAARTSTRPRVDLALWNPEAWGGITEAVTELTKADGHYPPGTWTTRAR